MLFFIVSDTFYNFKLLTVQVTMMKLIVGILFITTTFSFKFNQGNYELLLRRFDYQTQHNILEYCHSYETVPPIDKDILPLAPYTHVRYRCS